MKTNNFSRIEGRHPISPMGQSIDSKTVPLAVYDMLFKRWEEEVRRNARLENTIKGGCTMCIPPGKAKIINIDKEETCHV